MKVTVKHFDKEHGIKNKKLFRKHCLTFIYPSDK